MIFKVFTNKPQEWHFVVKFYLRIAQQFNHHNNERSDNH